MQIRLAVAAKDSHKLVDAPLKEVHRRFHEAASRPEVDKFIYIKAKCLPEMRKDRVYILKVVLKARELDIVYAECGCPAEMGPKGSCKHIAALPYALADFSRYKRLPEYRTSTDMLQQWNRFRQRHVEMVPVDELGSCRRQLTPSIRSYGSGVVFDPRPTCF